MNDQSPYLGSFVNPTSMSKSPTPGAVNLYHLWDSLPNSDDALSPISNWRFQWSVLNDIPFTINKQTAASGRGTVDGAEGSNANGGAESTTTATTNVDGATSAITLSTPLAKKPFGLDLDSKVVSQIEKLIHQRFKKLKTWPISNLEYELAKHCPILCLSLVGDPSLLLLSYSKSAEMFGGFKACETSSSSKMSLPEFQSELVSYSDLESQQWQCFTFEHFNQSPSPKGATPPMKNIDFSFSPLQVSAATAATIVSPATTTTMDAKTRLSSQPPEPSARFSPHPSPPQPPEPSARLSPHPSPLLLAARAMSNVKTPKESETIRSLLGHHSPPSPKTSKQMLENKNASANALPSANGALQQLMINIHTGHSPKQNISVTVASSPPLSPMLSQSPTALFKLGRGKQWINMLHRAKQLMKQDIEQRVVAAQYDQLSPTARVALQLGTQTHTGAPTPLETAVRSLLSSSGAIVTSHTHALVPAPAAFVQTFVPAPAPIRLVPPRARAVPSRPRRPVRRPIKNQRRQLMPQRRRTMFRGGRVMARGRAKINNRRKRTNFKRPA